MRTNLIFAVLAAALAFTGAAVAPASATSTSISFQRADVVLVVEVPAESTIDFDQLEFKSECLLENFVVAGSELADGAFSEVIFVVSSRGTCSIDLVDVPYGWNLVSPLQPDSVHVGNTESRWVLEPAPPGHTAKLRISLSLQVEDAGPIPLGEFMWTCDDGSSGSFDSAGTMRITAASSGNNFIYATLVRDIPVPPGRCGATVAVTEPGHVVSGGIPVKTADRQTSTVYFTFRTVGDEVFRCRGQLATIVGTDRDDVLIGTQGNDVIVADGGTDVVQGRGGDDLICGGPGDDELWGNGGADRIVAGPGADILRGGRGTDVLAGGAGNDIADGGPHRPALDICRAERTFRC